MPDAPFHVPVLLTPIIERARGARRVVDATLGHGGHAAALLDLGTELLGIDRDPDALATARDRLAGRAVTFLQSPYGSDAAIAAVAAFRPDFILLDLGVSSRQLDDGARGFSFRPGAPLDMRMGPDAATAADWLAETDERDMETALRHYADEPRASRLAREVIRRRANAPFATSDDLVNAIRAVLGPRSGPPDFARIFQGIRIAVNDELGGLARALPAFRSALPTGGTLAVISYHSGEDRLVKQEFRAWEQGCTCPPGLPQCICGKTPFGRAEPRKAIIPLAAEIAANPRARSAKLRFFRIDHAG
ncbi:MAG TPA: 16S rRNA (cytosine(1402)-N(4))-methyltransferase RsmH [Gemmatimonadales bacterium]|jgi:16S rRNA (cytosine1402-N4)-methyltransferase